MWEYVFESGSWSVFGLLVGYLVGRLERDVNDIKRKVNRR